MRVLNLILHLEKYFQIFQFVSPMPLATNPCIFHLCTLKIKTESSQWTLSIGIHEFFVSARTGNKLTLKSLKEIYQRVCDLRNSFMY